MACGQLLSIIPDIKDIKNLMVDVPMLTPSICIVGSFAKTEIYILVIQPNFKSPYS